MSLTLSDSLKKEYEVIDDTVYLKKDYIFESKFKKITIPKSEVIVLTRTKKPEENFVIDCKKKIRHSFLLKLKDELGIEFEKEYDLILDPMDNDLCWGYVRIPIKDSNIVADGEVHKRNLGDMPDYAYTTLFSRAEDRGILKITGLYSCGFFSEAEDFGEMEKSSNNTVDYDNQNRTIKEKKEDQPIKEVKEDKNTLLNKIKLLSVLSAENEEDIKLNISLALKEDYDSLDDITNDKLVLMLDYYENVTWEVDNKDDLIKALENVILKHKSDENWGWSEFNNEIMIVIEDLEEDQIPDELGLQDMYTLIEAWNLWGYKI